jgi:hypothetical protein
MNESEKEPGENKIEIAKFLLRNTESLRNEIHHTKLTEMVHPLTYTDDLENHPNLNLIPVFDKPENVVIRKKFMKLFQ